MPHPLSASALSLVLCAHVSTFDASGTDTRPRRLENSLGMKLSLTATRRPPKSPAKGRADRAITPTSRGGEHATPDPGFLR